MTWKSKMTTMPLLSSAFKTSHWRTPGLLQHNAIIPDCSMTSSVWGRIKERFSCRYKPKQDWLGLTNLSPRHHYRWGKKRRRRNVCRVSSQMRLIVMGTPLLCLGSKSEGFAVCSWCSAQKRASCGDTCVYVRAGLRGGLNLPNQLGITFSDVFRWFLL